MLTCACNWEWLRTANEGTTIANWQSAPEKRKAIKQMGHLRQIPSHGTPLIPERSTRKIWSTNACSNIPLYVQRKGRPNANDFQNNYHRYPAISLSSSILLCSIHVIPLFLVGFGILQEIPKGSQNAFPGMMH